MGGESCPLVQVEKKEEQVSGGTGLPNWLTHCKPEKSHSGWKH